MSDPFRIEDYKKMMADQVRMKAYQEAIHRVCPGKTVCEIGVGLGPLSLMALKAGATRVYGIERNPILLKIAETVISENGFDGKRFIPCPGISLEVSLPEKVDLILSETLSSMGIDENTVLFMRDAASRLLKPGGGFLPETLDCYLALADPSDYRAERRFWKEEMAARHGLDYGGMERFLTQGQHIMPVRTDELLSGWKPWQQVRFNDLDRYRSRTATLFPVEKAGEATGLGYAFRTLLCEGVALSTLPEAPATHWKQGFVAFVDPIRVERGDVVHVEMEVVTGPDPIRLDLKRRITHVPAAEVRGFLDSLQRLVNQKGEIHDP